MGCSASEQSMIHHDTCLTCMQDLRWLPVVLVVGPCRCFCCSSCLSKYSRILFPLTAVQSLPGLIYQHQAHKPFPLSQMRFVVLMDLIVLFSTSCGNDTFTDHAHGVSMVSPVFTSSWEKEQPALGWGYCSQFIAQGCIKTSHSDCIPDRKSVV